MGLEVERLATPNFAAGREGRSPRGIVVHTTVGSYEGAAAWFGDPDSGVSAHYLVGLDGRVAQFVEEGDTARHAGRVRDATSRLVDDGNPNLYTVGIEFEDGGDPEGVERPDLQYAAGAELIAEIAERWRIPLDRSHVIGHREVFAAKSCPGNLDIERLLEEATGQPSLVCLLPVRDGEADLPGYLESVSRFADAVVALDDGSTDATRKLLDASGVVREVLSNPSREGYGGWDDAENRQRLLDAGVESGARWLLFLDADERIDADDGAALREFVRSDALHGCAYGLELHRCWGEGATVGDPTWVYRMFAPAPGLRLPRRRLHFNPVPEQIPKAA